MILAQLQLLSSHPSAAQQVPPYPEVPPLLLWLPPWPSLPIAPSPGEQLAGPLVVARLQPLWLLGLLSWPHWMLAFCQQHHLLLRSRLLPWSTLSRI
ncbi:unnamed protein product [Acanthoscelides obtectus]|uniref:Uncharacterized protein n=1 Tax=Acanthoscelides obtectus TaxID=200917 RepID=A0A9P0LCF4_ACAOB|nr:unnamed protein product [Acanthoscelides obtectus]CAK1662776.1 hypothetical protein AOBTE_LOCUS23308 [Acanthoscelides obtectus]